MLQGKDVGEAGLRAEIADLPVVLRFRELLRDRLLEELETAVVHAAVNIYPGAFRGMQPLQDVRGLEGRGIVLPPPTPSPVVALESVDAVETRADHALQLGGIEDRRLGEAMLQIGGIHLFALLF